MPQIVIMYLVMWILFSCSALFLGAPITIALIKAFICTVVIAVVSFIFIGLAYLFDKMERT